MVIKLESEPTKIDQGLFKRLYDTAILKLPDNLRRDGMKKKNPAYNKTLKTEIELFLSNNDLIKTILEKPQGDAKILFDSIFNYLKVPEETLPEIRGEKILPKDRQKDLLNLA
jgi:hypothetical protein